MAPMSLVTYEEVRPWAKSIRQRVATRQMPPWHLDPTVGIQKFANDISLSSSQISTITRWVDAGAPLGDPKDLPLAKQWPDEEGWQLAKQFGQPDLVLKSDTFTVAALGPCCRDSPDDRRRPQGHAPRDRPPPTGRGRQP
jgi:hypothetical protein